MRVSAKTSVNHITNYKKSRARIESGTLDILKDYVTKIANAHL